MQRIRVFTMCACLSAIALLNLNNPCFSAENKVYNAIAVKTYKNIDTLIETFNFKDAYDQIQTILKAEPQNSNARAALGDLYSTQYKLNAAEAEYKKALALNPKNSDAHNGLGEIYLKKTATSDLSVIKNQNNIYDNALNEFNKAIALNPNNYKALNNIGKIYQKYGYLNKAQDYYQKSIDANSNFSDAYCNLGSILYEKNLKDEAINKYKTAIALNSKSSSAYYKLGEAYLSKGDISKAINYLNTSLYLFANSAPVHNTLGRAYEMQGNQAAAINEYKKAILIKPEYTSPYLSIANVYEKRGDQELAISELKNALSTSPNFLEAKFKIAEISLKSGKNDQAINYYKQVSQSPVYSKLAAIGLSKAYFSKATEVISQTSISSESDYYDAQNIIKEAIKLNPDDLQLYLALLRISRLTQNNNQSQIYLRKIVKSTENKPICHIIKGEAYITYKQYKEANQEFESALDLVQSTTDLLNMGEIFIQNRQYDIAKEAFNRVLEKDTNNPKAIKYLKQIRRNEDLALAKFKVAKSFYDDGQKMVTIEAMRDCVALNPNLPQAQLLLAKSFEKERFYYNAIEHYTAYTNLIDENSRDISKYNKKIKWLNNKLQKIEKKGKTPKKYAQI